MIIYTGFIGECNECINNKLVTKPGTMIFKRDVILLTLSTLWPEFVHHHHHNHHSIFVRGTFVIIDVADKAKITKFMFANACFLKSLL